MKPKFSWRHFLILLIILDSLFFSVIWFQGDLRNLLNSFYRSIIVSIVILPLVVVCKLIFRTLPRINIQIFILVVGLILLTLFLPATLIFKRPMTYLQKLEFVLLDKEMLTRYLLPYVLASISTAFIIGVKNFKRNQSHINPSPR